MTDRLGKIDEHSLTQRLGELMGALLEECHCANKLGNCANLDKKGTGYVAFDPFPTTQEYLDDLHHWKQRRK